MTIAEIQTAVDDGTLAQLIEAEAERYQREIMALFAHRQMLLQRTLTTMRELGCEAQIAHTHTRTAPDRGILCESYEFRDGAVWQHQFSYFTPTKGDFRPHARLDNERLIIWHGTHELVHFESRSALVVRVPNADDFEAGHRRTVAHLRNVARREGFKVTVRDRDITITDPMGAVLHEGTAITALAWIAGVDLNHPVEEPRA